MLNTTTYIMFAAALAPSKQPIVRLNLPAIYFKPTPPPQRKPSSALAKPDVLKQKEEVSLTEH